MSSDVLSCDFGTGAVLRRPETAEEIAAAVARADALASLRVRLETNLARLTVLGRKAAKYAKNPTANPALTAREQHELLARLALQAAADDEP